MVICALVTGTAIGSPYSTLDYGDFYRFKGVAPYAKVAFYDLGNGTSDNIYTPSDLNLDLLLKQYGYGARIFSQSWGENSSLGVYTISSQQVDTFMWDNKDALALFANGNYGDPKLTPGITPSGSVSPPATFKNGLSIGAALNDAQSWNSYSEGTASSALGVDVMAGFTSQGPTSDGRYKPDVLGPGFPVISAQAYPSSYGQFHTGLIEKEGTSMATPGGLVFLYVLCI